MRVLLAILLVFGLSVTLTGTQAGEKKEKEITLKGKICCAKCELGVETECMTVIKTKKDGKDLVVYFDAPSNKKHHASICSEAKDGSVTGTITTKDKKAVITVKSLKFD